MAQALHLVLAPDQAQRLESLLDRVTSVSIDTLLTYNELFAITGLHEKPPLYWLVIRANKELLPTKTMLVNVRGQGYRKATAHQQMAHADGRQLRGTRQFRKSHQEFVYTDRQQLTEMELTALDHKTQLARMKYDAATRKSVKAKALQRQATVSQEQAFRDLEQAYQQLRQQWRPVK